MDPEANETSRDFTIFHESYGKDEKSKEKKSGKKDRSDGTKSDRDASKKDGSRKEKRKKKAREEQLDLEKSSKPRGALHGQPDCGWERTITKKIVNAIQVDIQLDQDCMTINNFGKFGDDPMKNIQVKRADKGPVDRHHHHTIIKSRPSINMDKKYLSQDFPVLQECYSCGLLFANNHCCPAKEEKCSKCNKYGHFSGLCLQQKLQPLPQSPNNTAKYRENMKDNFIKSPLLNSPETFRRNMLDSIGKSKENHQETTDKTTVNEDPDKDIQEVMPKKKRFRGIADNFKQMQNIIAIKNEPIASLKEKLASAEAKNAKLEKVEEKLAAAEAKNAELTKSLDCEKKLMAQYQAKLKMYRNTSLSKTHNKLMDQFEIAQLTKQRDKLFAYTLKIQNNNDMVKQRVDDLVGEQKVIMTHLYKGDLEILPPWVRDCKYCGSKIAHNQEDCVAQGNTCKCCGVKNHFTAMCTRLI